MQASPGRPVQPRTSKSIPTKAGKTPHGAVLVGGASSTTGFNPLIAYPVIDMKMDEPTFEADGWFPAKPWAVNRMGENPRLVVVPAQFQGYEGGGALRRFTSLQFTVYYAASDDDDFMPPTVWKVEHQSSATEGEADFAVICEDSSGIQRVVMAYTGNGSTWQSRDLEYDGSQDHWETHLSGLTGQFIYFIQVVDNAGNVTVTSNKGLFFESPWYQIYLPLVSRNYQ